MDKMTKKILIVFVILVAAAVLIFAGVRIYQQKEAEEKGQSALPKTEVGKLLAKDLELEYPGTPTEVVKLFWRLNKCMYNTNMKEKDRKALYEQQRTLYDEELLQQKGNSEKDMYEALKKDIQKFDDNKNFISSYIVEEDWRGSPGRSRASCRGRCPHRPLQRPSLSPCRGGRLLSTRRMYRFYGNLRRIRNFPAGRCGHRPLQRLRVSRTAL